MVFEKASQNIGVLLIILLAGFLSGNALLLVGWPQTPQVQYFTVASITSAASKKSSHKRAS